MSLSYGSYMLMIVNFQMKGGSDYRSVPGNTIAVQADMPFGGLTKFGTSFLSKFECSQMPHPVSFVVHIYSYCLFKNISYFNCLVYSLTL